MKKDKIVTIRVSEKEKKKLIEKSEVAKLSLSEYLIKQGLDKEIVIVDGLSEVVSELRRIGNNINQLTYLATSGRIYTVDLSEVLSKENYDSFIAIIHNTNLSLLSKITFLVHLFSQEDKILNVGISIQGTITLSGDVIISNSHLSLNSSSFLDKSTLFEAVRANYYMLKADYLFADMWYLYVGNEAIYLLSNGTISPSKGLISLDTCEKEAISTLFEHNTDSISLFEAKDIVLRKIIPFMHFVHPSVLIVGGALASQEVSSFVYSDFKALNISEVKFDDSNFAKSIACFAMSKFFKGRE